MHTHSARVRLALAAPPLVVAEKNSSVRSQDWKSDPAYAKDPARAAARMKLEAAALAAFDAAVQPIMPAGISPFQKCMLYRQSTNHARCPRCPNCPKVGYRNASIKPDWRFF